MKKLFLSVSATLLCLLALSQEDNLGNYAELTFTPRLDLNPTYSDQKLGFNHGNTSIYTLFEGSASEHFSWTLANHWFSIMPGRTKIWVTLMQRTGWTSARPILLSATGALPSVRM